MRIPGSSGGVALFTVVLDGLGVSVRPANVRVVAASAVAALLAILARGEHGGTPLR